MVTALEVGNEEWAGPASKPSGALVNCPTNERREAVLLLQGGQRVKMLTVPTSSALDEISDKRHPLNLKQQKKQGLLDRTVSQKQRKQTCYYSPEGSL